MRHYAFRRAPWSTLFGLLFLLLLEGTYKALLAVGNTCCGADVCGTCVPLQAASQHGQLLVLLSRLLLLRFRTTTAACSLRPVREQQLCGLQAPQSCSQPISCSGR